MQIAVLGPMRVSAGDQVVALGPPRQRLLLAVLIARAGATVTTDAVVDALWGSAPPPSAVDNIYLYVYRLRAALGRDRLAGQRRSGYTLVVRPGELDAQRFADQARAGREALDAGDASLAGKRLREALAGWRGRPYEDLADEPALGPEVGRLAELRLDTVEHRVEADLRLGLSGELVGELSQLVEEHPYRERFTAQLMRAFYRGGRQAEALAAYRRCRAVLAEQLGLEPGPELRRLERSILAGEPDVERHTERVTAAGPPETHAPPAVPAQLPADVADFTGREAELAQLEEMAGAGLVAITGAAGVGKTALAVHWAHRVAGRFPDGQLFVDLRGRDPEQPVSPLSALGGFLAALGADARTVPLDTGGAAALFRTLLAGRRMLVVLDNAENADQVRPLLPGGAGCLVVVTSRSRLGGLSAREGARRLAVDVLDEATATRLLARIVGAERVAREGAAAAALVAYCGRLPLALRIAAANVADAPDRGLAKHVATLHEARGVGLLSIDGDERHAVPAAFDHSYRSVPVDTRRLFRMLGLTPGPDFTVEGAAALVGRRPAAVRAALARLSETHMIERRADGRFGFHDLLRRYARDRVEAEEPADSSAAAIRRLLDWYLDAAEAAAALLYPHKLRLPMPVRRPTAVVPFDGVVPARDWLDAERHNLVAAVQYAAEHGLGPVAWLIADRLRGYFWLRVHVVDWLTVARAGLAAAESAGDLAAQAAMHTSVADLHWRQGRFREGLDHFGRALHFARRGNWPEAQATATANAGALYSELGDRARAARSHERSLALHRAVGRPAGEAGSLANLAILYSEVGALRRSADYHERALALFRQVGSRMSEGITLGNLGEVEAALGRYDQALAHLTEAIGVHRETGNRPAEADSLRGLGGVYADLGRRAEALETLGPAVEMAARTGKRQTEARALNALGATFLLDGEHEEAARRFGEARRIAEAIGARHAEVRALIGCADAYRLGGRRDKAGETAVRALELAREARFRVLEGYALMSLAQAGDDTARSVEQARKAIGIHRRAGHRLGEARALAVLGSVMDDPRAAARHRRAATALFAELGVPAPRGL